MIDGTGNVGYDLGAGGLAVGDNTRRPRLFKIVSGSNPYTADELVLQESDGTTVVTGVYDVSAAEKTLHETQGRTTVQPNTIVEATPNPTGLGFYFTAPSGSVCDNLPLTFTVQVGTSVTTAVVSGTTVVTGVTKRLRDITITEDGCFELGEPYCEAATTEACVSGEDPGPPASPSWYCVEGHCAKYYDNIEPDSYDAGPFASKSLCVAGCPPAGTIDTSCCPDDLLPEVLTVTIPSGPDAGSWSAEWNGSSEWRREHVKAGPFITIACVSGLWYITIAGNSVTATETSCDPLSITFTVGGVSCTITE